jgi:hypothetical protein
MLRVSQRAACCLAVENVAAGEFLPAAQVSLTRSLLGRAPKAKRLVGDGTYHIMPSIINRGRHMMLCCILAIAADAAASAVGA